MTPLLIPVPEEPIRAQLLWLHVHSCSLRADPEQKTPRPWMQGVCSGADRGQQAWGSFTVGHGDGTGFRRECISCRLDYERQNILLAMNVKMSVHRYNGHGSEMNRTRSSLLGEGVAEQGCAGRRQEEEGGRGPFLMQKAICREMRWISRSSSIGRAWSPGALTEWPPIEGNFNIYQQPRFVSCS